MSVPEKANFRRKDMMHKGRKARNVIAPIAAALMLAVSGLAQPDSEKILYTFPGGRGGGSAGVNFISDAAGNLYGTTFGGGNNSKGCESATGIPGCGTVFELISHTDGTWTKTLLHVFTGGSDGAIPAGGVVMDSAGNLYGTTWFGGDKKSKNCRGSGLPAGCGVVYELTPTPHGPWQQTVLYTFTGGNDGGWPFAGVILDSSGNLYGAGSYFGAFYNGVIFQLSPNGQGPWTENVLYAFTGASDGGVPYGAVTFDSAGNLYGVTAGGGDLFVSCFYTPGCGVVFKLSLSGGQWTETVMHVFTGGADGAYPLLALTVNQHGAVFGSTAYGGNTSAPNCLGGYGINTPAGCGVVFKLDPQAHGQNGETVLYTFNGGSDGAFAGSPVMFDSAGNLYGVTGNGGDYSGPCMVGSQISGCGVVFKLTPASKGPWTESVLYTFTGGSDGAGPETNLIFDSAGDIFGTTESGGNTSVCSGNFSGPGCGVIFELQ